MSLFDIYKAKTLGVSTGSLFDAKTGGKLNKDAWKKGFNKWDEEWEQGSLSTSDGSDLPKTSRVRSKNHIKVVPEETYYFRLGTGGSSNGLLVCFYDSEKTFISGAWQAKVTVTIPSGANYIRFSTGDVYGGTYNNDICINISGEHDGEYMPYSG